MADIQTLNVSTWEEFQERLKPLRDANHKNAARLLPLLFRGQENSEWPLNTTLERANQAYLSFVEYYRRIIKIRPEIESFTDRKWRLPKYIEVLRDVREYDAFSLKLTAGRLPAYAYMAYLRHHGFPSPLLDWTRSSHVAAFFAFRKAIWGSVGTQKKASIFVLAPEPFNSGGNRMPMVTRLGPYVRTHRRHFLQQSEYTVCTIFKTDWRFAQYADVFNYRNAHQGVFQKFNIPLTEGPKVLRLLDEYNLNASSVFSSEEGLMETLAMREFAPAPAVSEVDGATAPVS